MTIFTKIINREIPAEIVYEDEQTIAFLDIHPINPGHLLVVPKENVDEFQDLDSETYQHLMGVVRDMAKLIKERINPPRIGLIVQGFDVPHAHIHVVPLYDQGDITTSRTPELMNTEPDFDALKLIREKLTS